MTTDNCVQYSFSGLKNLTLTENSEFEIKNNQYVNAILLDDDLKSVTIYLKDGVCYSDSKLEIELFLNQIFFNLIAKSEADITFPTWNLAYTKEGSNANLYDYFCLNEDIEVFRSNRAYNIYDIVVNSSTAINNHTLLYNRIFCVLQNPNIVVQFMSLYEILLDNARNVMRVGKGQINVAKYLELHKEDYPFVKFQPSRDQTRKWKEDTFTYIRNEIGHCEKTNDLVAYKKAGSKINTQLIKKLLIVLNDVIMLLPEE